MPEFYTTEGLEGKFKSWMQKAQKREAQREKQTEKAQKQREKAALAKSEKKRDTLLRRAEKYEIRANKKKVRAKQYAGRAKGEINDREWSRINKSRRNHWFYDRISDIVTAFRPRNPLRKEGMSFTREMGGMQKTFENQGRIFLGGTKAMNRYVDEQGKDWLCKEAVTCIGTKKPMGALVTEAASRLQERISPDTAVRSFVYRDANGEVCGSLQERLSVDEKAIDLFKWQTRAKEEPLPAGLADQILREHVTDWLLCNFDTKGENFLIDTEGHLRGIDKEQAFSYLDHPETQHMSYTYSPNPNQPLYNTLFTLYVNGDMELNFAAVKPFVDRVKAIPDAEYRAMFQAVVDQKTGGDSKRAQTMMDRIVARKDGLEEEYRSFFSALERDRAAAKEVIAETIPTQDARDAGSSLTQKTPVPPQTHRRPLDLSEQLHTPTTASHRIERPQSQKTLETPPKEKRSPDLTHEL